MSSRGVPPSRSQAVLMVVVATVMLIAGGVNLLDNGFSTFGLLWLLIVGFVGARALRGLRRVRHHLDDRPSTIEEVGGARITSPIEEVGWAARIRRLRESATGLRESAGRFRESAGGFRGTDPSPRIADHLDHRVADHGPVDHRSVDTRSGHDDRPGYDHGWPMRRRSGPPSRTGAVIGALVGLGVIAFGLNFFLHSEWVAFLGLGERMGWFPYAWAGLGGAIILTDLYSAFFRRNPNRDR
ncbi:hypothetical protein [Micromonospora fluostatini]|uniref:hypothetical protein n=1 Tax=Micromonospora sp. JCM 30529 TaxID=3421643 RepID=UPI003D17EA7B